MMRTALLSERRTNLRWYCVLAFTFFVFCTPTHATEQPRIQGFPEIQSAKSSGAGTTLLFVRNDSATSLNVTLSAGPVTTRGTASATDAQVSFAAENDTGPGESSYTFTLGASSTGKVKVLVAKAWGSSPMNADLLNGTTTIGKLLILPSPINVSLVEPTSEKPDLNLTDGDPAKIILKNDDSVPYALAFRLIVNNQVLAGHEFELPARRSTILDFAPRMTVDWALLPMFLQRLREVFRPQSAKPGTLFLYQKQGNVTNYSSPVATIHLNTAFNYFSPEWRSTLNYVLIIVILILGGIASLTFGHSLPNLLDRLSVIEQLNTLARTTANLSSNVGSQLGVLVRLERSRLYDLLKSRTTISPDFEATLSQCKSGVAKLSSRVTLLQQLDVVIGRLTRLARMGVPPSRIDDIRQSLEQTSEILKKDNPEDTDLQDSRKSITAALVSLDSINEPNPDFGKALAQRVHDICKVIPVAGSNAAFDRICGRLPGPIAALRAIPTSATDIVPASYASVDTAIRKTQIIREYADLAEGTTDPNAKGRLQEWEDQLGSHLSTQSWEALQAAILLLREMKDDLYPERLRDSLVASPVEAFVKMEPPVAYEEEPLEFTIYFSNHFINTAAAREEWTCSWEFGDGLEAEGWLVSHYFILPKCGPFQPREAHTFKVSASFRDAAGKVVAQVGNNDPITVTEEINVRPSRLRAVFGERTVAEVARLSAALLIAIFALIAGAKAQLVKLDLLPGLLAVFVAGYGVDVLKNLINSGKAS